MYIDTERMIRIIKGGVMYLRPFLYTIMTYFIIIIFVCVYVPLMSHILQ